jgi:hypothetical protein
VFDSADLRFLSILTGSSTPRSAESVSRLIASMEALDGAEFTAGMVALSVDYDDSGELDEGDIAFVVALLKDDPVGKYDFDGSGVLDLRDVGHLAENLESVTGREAAMTYDVSGDGVVDDTDLMLLGELAIYVTDIEVGLMDHNLDTKITLDDFCVVTETGADANPLGLVMVDGDVSTVQAKTALCRADGKSLIRHPLNFDTGQEFLFLPQELYVEEVAATPGDSNNETSTDGVHFVVTTTPTDRRFVSLALPGFTGHEDERSRVRLAGPELPAGAMLVTEMGVLPMTPFVEESENTLGGSSTSGDYEVHILSVLVTEEEVGQALAFQDRLNEALQTYDSYIAQCPCTLEPITRAELVQGLLRMKNCLAAVGAAARAALEDTRANHGMITREHVFSSQIAALKWQYLSGLITDAAWFKVLLQSIEACIDLLTGGPGKALKEQLGNVAGFGIDRVLRGDYWKESETGSPPLDMALGVGVGAAHDVLPKPFIDAMQRILDIGGKRLSPKVFGKLFIEQLESTLPKLNPPDLESILRAVIKALPDLYVAYAKAEALLRERQAQESAKSYNESVFTIGSWENVITSMDEAVSKVDEKLAALNKKFQDDGCPMSMTDSDPCQPVLTASLQVAKEAFEADLAAANARIEAVGISLSGTETRNSCASGADRQEMEEAQLDATDRARAVMEKIGKLDPEQLVADLEIEQRHSAEALEEAKRRFEAKCLGELLTLLAQDDSVWQEVKAAQEAKQKALDDHAQAIRDAIAAYQACAGGGDCAGTATGEGSPWTAALACLNCVPEVVMDCGDPSECADDPDLEKFAKLAKLFEQEQEMCSLERTVDIQTLLHSWEQLSEKAVANDQTTIGRILYHLSFLNQNLLNLLFNNSAFECGPGPNGLTLCSDSPQTATEGDWLLVATVLDASMPTSDPTNYYQYGFVFDADGDTSNNYRASAPYSRDFFDNTDRWYVASYSPSAGWALEVSTANGSGITPVTTTAARIIIEGNTMLLAVPLSEFSVAKPSYRVTAFRHTGDWGTQAPHNYDGSIWPAVADGLASAP